MTTIQLRRGTAAQWAAANPVLADGEVGLEKDTTEIKYGDGITPWNSLPYYAAEALAHTHTAADISDASTVGRNVLKAADATAARTAIGAGTSSLALGTTGTTAMAGNKTFAFSEITGTLGTNQLPPLAIGETFPVASQAAMLALTAQQGDVAIRSDISKSFILSTNNPGTLADWLELLTPGAPVTSVAGKTGVVTLVKADVGLSNVDNTADSAKPVSTAQQTALNAKAPLASPAFTGTPTGITKTHVGLGNVDNTADSAKPVSTAQQTALNGKANTSHTHAAADITSIDGGAP